MVLSSTDAASMMLFPGTCGAAVRLSGGVRAESLTTAYGISFQWERGDACCAARRRALHVDCLLSDFAACCSLGRGSTMKIGLVSV
jgi:hypothetical protein